MFVLYLLAEDTREYEILTRSKRNQAGHHVQQRIGVDGS